MPRFWVSLLLVVAALPAAESADWMIAARWVVTMDAQRRILENGAVAVKGDRILAAGPRDEVRKRYSPRRVLDRPNALLAPGLVNTHSHAPMSLFRGLADDVPLREWLEKYIFPAEARNVTREFVLWGTRLACLEMMLAGTTTFTDMYYFEDAIAEGAKEAGMRAVLGETILDFPAPDYKTPADALRFNEAFIERYRNDPLVMPAVAPHALYTDSDETLKAARALANRYGAPLMIHLAETRRELEETLAKRGTSPIRVLDSLGIFEGRTLANHVVWADEADLKVLKSRGVGIAHCPSSNMKMASGIAPVVRMLSLGLAVGLGSDGPAGSNNDFNLFEEMDLAAKLQKVATGNPQALPAATALEMATLGGARALGLESRIGSLEPGKRADLITIRADAPHAVPAYDVYSQMVYSLKASDVLDVMVNGRWIVRDRASLTLPARQILERAAQYRRKVQDSLR